MYIFAGDEANSKRGVLNISHPVQRGKGTDWDLYQKVLHQAFWCRDLLFFLADLL
jgi:actin-related protein